MDKRLLKRHKRQVLRAKERVRVSEPDLRTPEQLRAAREASRAVPGHGSTPLAPYSTPPTHKPEVPAGDASANADVVDEVS